MYAPKKAIADMVMVMRRDFVWVNLRSWYVITYNSAVTVLTPSESMNQAKINLVTWVNCLIAFKVL